MYIQIYQVESGIISISKAIVGVSRGNFIAVTIVVTLPARAIYA